MCSDGGVGCSHVFNQFGKKKTHKLSHFIIQIKQKKSRNISGSIKKRFDYKTTCIQCLMILAYFIVCWCEQMDWAQVLKTSIALFLCLIYWSFSYCYYKSTCSSILCLNYMKSRETPLQHVESCMWWYFNALFFIFKKIVKFLVILLETTIHLSFYLINLRIFQNENRMESMKSFTVVYM